MNLPNKLTMLRILLIPVFMVVLYWDFPGATWVAVAIFIIASFTDLLDGKIARKYNLVTDFGKFADPLADKMLVTAALLWFVEIGQMPAWALLIVLVREFAVSGLRMIASDKGRVIAAGWSGKVKTASTMVCIVLMFLPIPGLDNREFVKTAIEVLRGRTLYGKRVVVAGGGMTGAETAVFLAVQGCDVTMIEMAPDIITDAVAQPRACLLEHIRKYNVKVHTQGRRGHGLRRGVRRADHLQAHRYARQRHGRAQLQPAAGAARGSGLQGRRRGRRQQHQKRLQEHPRRLQRRQRDLIFSPQ